VALFHVSSRIEQGANVLLSFLCDSRKQKMIQRMMQLLGNDTTHSSRDDDERDEKDQQEDRRRRRSRSPPSILAGLGFDFGCTD
jgi:hypothetical protein